MRQVQNSIQSARTMGASVVGIDAIVITACIVILTITSIVALAIILAVLHNVTPPSWALTILITIGGLLGGASVIVKGVQTGVNTVNGTNQYVSAATTNQVTGVVKTTIEAMSKTQLAAAAQSDATTARILQVATGTAPVAVDSQVAATQENTLATQQNTIATLGGSSIIPIVERVMING